MQSTEFRVQSAEFRILLIIILAIVIPGEALAEGKERDPSVFAKATPRQVAAQQYLYSVCDAVNTELRRYDKSFLNSVL